MLLLLLLTVFISFLPTFSCIVMHEFMTEVENFGNSVQNCSKNCSSVHILDGTCKCLNLSKSAEKCASHSYAIDALNSLHPLHPGIRNKKVKRNLIKLLDKLNQTSNNFCSLPLNLSPKTLFEELKLLGERHSSHQSP